MRPPVARSRESGPADSEVVEPQPFQDRPPRSSCGGGPAQAGVVLVPNAPELLQGEPDPRGRTTSNLLDQPCRDVEVILRCVAQMQEDQSLEVDEALAREERVLRCQQLPRRALQGLGLHEQDPGDAARREVADAEAVLPELLALTPEGNESPFGQPR